MQDVHAQKAMKPGGQLVAKGLGKGAVLSLNVDYHTNAHASRLLVIVYSQMQLEQC